VFFFIYVVNFILVFYIVVQPYATLKDNRVELFNEVMVMLLGYSLYN
jgi:hypothetical protein